MEIVGYVVVAMFLMVACYTALRWVHHVFKVREIMVQSQHRDMNIHTASMELHALTEDMIRHMNDQLQKAFNMGES